MNSRVWKGFFLAVLFFFLAGCNTGISVTTTTTSIDSTSTTSTTSITDSSTTTSNLPMITIHFESNGGSLVDAFVLGVGSSFNPPEEPSKEGHTFIAWFTDEALTNSFSFGQVVYESMTLYAMWQVNTYTVLFVDYDNTVFQEREYEYGDTIIPLQEPPVEREGYTFTSWSPVVPQTMPAYNVTFKAQYEVIQCTVFFADSDGTVLFSIELDYSSLVQEPTAPVKMGHTFLGWYEDQNLTRPYAFNLRQLKDDMTLYAKWDVMAFTFLILDYDGSDLVRNYIYFDSDLTSYGYANYTPTRTGYTFLGFDKEIPARMPDHDVTFYAQYRPNSYTITFESNGGSEIEGITQDVDTVITLPIPEKTGYRFVGWFTNPSLDHDFTDTLMPAENKTLHAKWEVNQYTLSFETYGGTTIPSITRVYQGSIQSVNQPEKQGHTFAGWFIDEAYTTPYTFSQMPAYDFTIYAKWNVNSYNLRYVDDNQSELASFSVPYGSDLSTLEEPTPSKVGHTFTGWDQSRPSVMPDYDITIKAKYQLNQYTISFETNGGSTIEDIVEMYGYAILQPASPMKEGHTFGGWYQDSNLTTSYSFTGMPAEDIIVYAKWNINQYTITFNTNGGTPIDSITQDYDSILSLSLIPTKVGHSFAGWYEDSSGTIPFMNHQMPARNLTLYGHWTTNNYTLRYLDENQSELATFSVAYGSNLSHLQTPNPSKIGYTFTTWNQVLPSTMPDHDITLTAIYQINQYTLSFETNGGSLIHQITQDYQTHILPPEDPSRLGYTFGGWYLDSEFIVAYPFNTMPAENKIIYAKWNINSYTLQFIDDQGVVLQTHDIPYQTGLSAITPPQTSKVGHTFNGWDREIPTTMPADNLTLQAQYLINQYTITFHTNGGSDVTSITQDYGSILSEPIQPTKLGYTFGSWYLDEECTLLYAFTTMPAEDVILYAKWGINSYTLEFQDEDGQRLHVFEIEYNQDLSTILPSSPIKIGHQFIDWNPSLPLVMPAHDVVLKATYQINQYTIYFETNGGTSVDDINKDYDSNVAEPTQPIKTGHQFRGWYTDETFNQIYSFTTMPAEDLVLYAKWEVKSFVLKYVDDEDQELLTLNIAYNSDLSNIEEPVPSKVGYSFLTWDQVLPSTMPDYDLTLKAQFQINQYTITFISNGGTSVSQITMEYNASIQVPTNPEKTGYAFGGWFIDSSLSSSFTFLIMPAEDLTLYAKWNINSYHLSFTDYDGRIVWTMDFVYGQDLSDISEPTVNRIGYTFTSWSAQIPQSMPANNVIIEAQYSINQYSITFISNGGSSVSTITLDYDTSIQAPTNPEKLGYTFGGWFLESSLMTPYEFTMMPAENLELYAKWSINSYTLSFVDFDGQVLWTKDYEYSAEVSGVDIPVANRLGYTFVSWSMELPSFMPAQHVIIQAQYEVNYYTIEFLDIDGSRLTLQSYAYGSNLTQIDYPAISERPGYSFESWNPVIPTSMPAEHLVLQAIDHFYLIYQVMDSTVHITGVDRPLIQRIVIPNEIDGYPVTIVSSAAFAELQYVTTVVLPSTLITIGSEAFMNMKSLQSIVIPNSVQYIYQNIFSGTESLESLTIPFIGQSRTATSNEALMGYLFGKTSYPGSYLAFSYYFPSTLTQITITDVASIGSSALRDMNKVVSITLPSSLETIGTHAFYNLKALQSLTIPGSVTTIGAYAFYNLNNIPSLVIPPLVTVIQDYTFYGLSKATSITIPSGVTSIGVGAFYGASKVESIIIPDSVLTIGASAFRNIGSATTLVLPSQIKIINTYAFYGANKITSLVIPSGVTSIGTYAFYGINSVQTLTIPNTVTTISNYAFYGAGNIVSLDIPNSVTSIGTYAFYGISKVETLVIPNSITSVSNYAFYGAASVTTLVIPNTITNIGEGAFYGMTNLSDLSIPDSVTTLGMQAFYGLSSVTSLVLPNSIITMGDGVFRKASSLLTVQLPNQITVIPRDAFRENTSLQSITIPDSVRTINNQAFFGATSITSILIPNTVTHIGAGVFGGISGLTTITLPFLGESRTATGVKATFGYAFGTASYADAYYANGYYLPISLQEVILTDTETVALDAMKGAKNIQTIVLPNTLTTIGDYAFRGMESITHLIIPNSVTQMGTGMLNGMKSLNTLMIPFLGASRDITDETGRLGYLFGTTNTGQSLYFYSANGYVIPYALRKVIVTNATILANSAFHGMHSIEEILLPSTVESIGSYAFYGLVWLDELTIPANTTSIGDWAFAYLNSMTSIDIPSHVSNIGVSVFAGSGNLSTFTVHLDNPYYKSVDGVLFNHSMTTLVAYPPDKQNTEYHIPQGVERIIDSAFFEAINLTVLTLPTTIHTIGKAAFALAENIQSLIIPEGVTIIEDETFFAMSQLMSIQLPEGITNIGKSVFYFNVHLTQLILPSTVQSIGEYSFAYMTSLESIVIPHGVTMIANSLFIGAESLVSVYLPDTITSIGSWAFSDNQSLASIELPSGLTSIGISAFENAISLTSIVIPYGVTVIESYTFRNNLLLTAIELPETITRIELGAFHCVSSLETLVIPNSVEYIAPSALYGMSQLQSLTIPFVGETKESTGLAALFGYIFGTTLYNNSYNANGYQIPSTLKDLYITGAITIVDSAFYNVYSLQTMVISETLQDMGEQVFYGLNQLVSITLPFTGRHRGESGTRGQFGVIFGKTTYTGSYNANEYRIPQTLKEVHITDNWAVVEKAFYEVYSVTTLTINEGIIEIWSSAFYGMNLLTHLVLPQTLVSLRYYALAGMPALKEIVIPNSVQLIQDNVLKHAISLEKLTLPYLGSTRDCDPSIAKLGYIFGAESYSTLQTYTASNYFIPKTLKEIEVTDITVVEPFAFKGILATSITIPSTVTTIGERAFESARELTSFTMPTSLTSLGAYSFAGVRKLSSIAIPSGISSIPEGAFQGMSNLVSVQIPETITSIGSYAFDGASSLLTVEIPAGVSSIEPYTFRNTSSLTSITLPSSITTIGSYAFDGASSLVSFEIPHGVTIIESNTFRNTFSLQSIIIPESVEIIRQNAFYAARSLTNLVIPNSVVLIEASAFYGTASLQSISIPFVGSSRSDTTPFGTIFGQITYPGGYYAHGYYVPEYLEEIIITDAETIPFMAFSALRTVITLVISDQVTYIGENVFREMSNLQSLTIPFIGEHRDDVSTKAQLSYLFSIYECSNCYYTGRGYLPSSLTEIKLTNAVHLATEALYNGHSITTLYIPDMLSTIYDYAFAGMTQLTTIHIDPNNNHFAFQDGMLFNQSMTDLILYLHSNTRTSFEIPEGVTRVYPGAFMDNGHLKTVVIPENLTTIGALAFSKMSELEAIEVHLSNSAYASVDGVLYTKDLSVLLVYPAKKLDTSYVSPDSVLSISAYAFYQAEMLEEIILSNFVTSIDSFAFAGLSQIRSITLPFVGSGYHVSGESGKFGFVFGTKPYPDSYLSSGYYIPISLQEVIITNPSTIVSKAFIDVKSIKALSILGNPETMGQYALQGMSQLQSLTIPYLGNHTRATGSLGHFGYLFGSIEYENSYLAGSYYFPIGLVELLLTNIQIIAQGALAGVYSLEQITLPNTLSTINSYAFSYLNKVTTLVIPSATLIDMFAFKGMSSLESISLPFVGQQLNPNNDEAGTFGYVFGIEDYPNSYQVGRFFIPNELTEVIITGGSSISGVALAGLKSVHQLTLPDTLQSIGSGAFKGMDQLHVIHLNPNHPYLRIIDGAIYIMNNPDPRELYFYLPNNEETSYSSPYVVTTIHSWAFFRNQYLTHIHIPGSISSIGAYAFSYTQNLVSIDVHEDNSKYQSIDGVLYNEKMTELLAYPAAKNPASFIIPESVSVISYGAFRGNNSLVELTLPNTVKYIYDYAFANSINLISIVIPDSVIWISANAFQGCDNLTIYVAASSKPSGWAENWNPDSLPVVWGYVE